jgi:hypothetical protein
LARFRLGVGGSGSPSAFSARRIEISASMTGAPSSALHQHCSRQAPFRSVVLRLRESRDKFSGVTKREQLAAIPQDDRIGESAGPAFWHKAQLTVRLSGFNTKLRLT